MGDKLLLGIGRHIVPILRAIWWRQVVRGAQNTTRSLRFMTKDHRLVRVAVVRDLPRSAPDSPALRLTVEKIR